jgi:hypothetical protein
MSSNEAVGEQLRIFGEWAYANELPNWAQSLPSDQRQTARQAAAAELRNWQKLNITVDELCRAVLDRVVNRLTKKGPFDEFHTADGAVNVGFVKNHFKGLIHFLAIDAHRAQRRTLPADDVRLEIFLRQRPTTSAKTFDAEPPQTLEPAAASIVARDGWQRVLTWLADRGTDDVRCPLHPMGCKDPDVILGAAVVHLLFLLRPDLEPGEDAVPRLANPPKHPLDPHMYLLWQVVHPSKIRLRPDGTPSSAVTTAKGRMPFLCWLHLLDRAPDHEGRTFIRRQLQTTLTATIDTLTRDLTKNNTADNRNKIRIAKLWREDLG